MRKATRVRDGDVVRFKVYADRTEALEAAGLRDYVGPRFFRDGVPAHCATAPRKNASSFRIADILVPEPE
jgi:hypothetical protein